VAADTVRHLRLERRVQLHAADLRERRLAAPIQLPDARGDPRAADLLVHPERCAHGPLVLVREEAAGGRAAGIVGSGRRPIVHPVPVRLEIGEGRNHYIKPRPALRARPDDASTAWTKDPLVRAGGEEVATQPGDGLVRVPKPG